MQNIFEVTDDDGSVSYLHMGDPEQHDGRASLSDMNETFSQTYFKQNKAVMWSQSDIRPANLFPLFNSQNRSFSPMFKSAE